ncbi:MAG: hypothetical protein JWR50_4282, partial [Mucilaginibacter sp.]|nr:hypothetical protein [Mucilaginibacter sp.]
SAPVTVTLNNATLDDALKASLQGQALSYEIEDGTIIIKEKDASSIDKAKALFAQITVSGKVTDETGQPLPGVTVKQKGIANGTITDPKGLYSLTVPDDKAVITFSYIGYEIQELAAKDIPNGSVIILKATSENLKEVVISKGYYNEKRELSTGNVSVVTAKEIGEQPVSDPIMALEGRVPGLQISQASGIPGASLSVQIRGQNSISNGSNPLYIIDGVPFAVNNSAFSGFSNSVSNNLTPLVGAGALGSPGNPGSGISIFNNLNPGDIESIEVLKDADATSLYGSRGANGVILITTKKGKAGDTKVDLIFSQGIGKVDKMLPLLNTQQYLALRHQIYKNDNTSPGPTDYDINGAYDTTRYTNWQELLIGNSAQYTNAQLSLSGGNANNQFLISGTYGRQTTVFPGNYSDQKGSVHVNLNHSSSDQRFHVLFTANYTNDNNTLPLADLTPSIFLAPDAPAPYDKDGNVNFQNGTFTQNPYKTLLGTSNAVTNNLISNINLSYVLLTGLKLSLSAGYNHIQLDQDLQRPGSFFPPPLNTLAFLRRHDYATNEVSTWNVEPQLNYVKDIGNGKLDILLGTTFQENNQNEVDVSGTGYSSDDIIQNLSSATNYFINNSASTYKYNAIFSRINYNWREKYIINVTARRDGSSRFGPGNQYGNFGAIGAAWVFSKEKFVENNWSFLSFGKLRGSYGVTGNDQIPDYQYLSSYGSGAIYQGVNTLTPLRISNPNFRWEIVKKLEGGIELGFLKDRIIFSGVYFVDRTGNQLVGYPLPSKTWFTIFYENLPAGVQNTGIELEVNSINIRTNNFKWNSAINLSIPNNKLISYPDLAGSSYSNAYVIGQPLSIQKVYHFTGVDTQTGLYTVEDANHDGQITSPQDQQTIIQIAKKYYGGFSNSFSYKNFSLDIFLQFVKQTGRNYLYYLGIPGSGLNNSPADVQGGWQKPGDNSKVQKYSLNGDAINAYYNYLTGSDAVITDASFIRLKNLSLSYNIPSKWQERAHLHNARIFLQGQNLFTITKYKGFDPETQSNSLPPLRMITTGIQLTF